jgi:hypothetical protein
MDLRRSLSIPVVLFPGHSRRRSATRPDRFHTRRALIFFGIFPEQKRLAKTHLNPTTTAPSSHTATATLWT